MEMLQVALVGLIAILAWDYYLRRYKPKFLPFWQGFMNGMAFMPRETPVSWQQYARFVAYVCGAYIAVRALMHIFGWGGA